MSEGSSGDVNRTLMEEKQGRGGGIGRSCKGYIYYSSTLTNDKHPRRVGIPRSLRQGKFFSLNQMDVSANFRVPESDRSLFSSPN